MLCLGKYTERLVRLAKCPPLCLTCVYAGLETEGKGFLVTALTKRWMSRARSIAERQGSEELIGFLYLLRSYGTLCRGYVNEAEELITKGSVVFQRLQAKDSVAGWSRWHADCQGLQG